MEVSRRIMKGRKECGERQNEEEAESTRPANGRIRKRKSGEGNFP